jgi:molybdate transport system substrate-binding protein
MMNWIKAIFGAIALLSGLPSAGRTTEFKVLSPVAMRGAMTGIAIQFERTSGHKLVVDFATAGAVAARLQSGEAADVAITSDAQLGVLIARGRLVDSTRSGIARVGLGLFVKNGGPKPTIDTVAAFKQTMLSAKVIGYGDPAAGGVSGVHMSRVVGSLGLEDLQSRIRLYPDSQAVMSAVANGDVDIGFGLTSDGILVSGVELAAPLPADIQSFTEYGAAVVTGTGQEAVARDFVKYLSSPAAQQIWKSMGFEPR